MKNDFQTNNEPLEKRSIISNNTGVFIAAVFLIGIECIAGIMSIVKAVAGGCEQFKNAVYVSHIVFYISIMCVFISLLQICISENAFSRIFSRCMIAIGIIQCVASLILPRLSDYQSSGIEIISTRTFVLCDGMYLTLGLLFIILGRIIKVGFEMQKEMNSIL